MPKFFVSAVYRPAIRRSLVDEIRFDDENYVIRFFRMNEYHSFVILREWECGSELQYIDEKINLKRQLQGN